ncbi:DUF4124 domain-containing protein [Sesbania bispinosa]|nr:DUF4124 domain-containing protein [Sesbania bispinosa]
MRCLEAFKKSNTQIARKKPHRHIYGHEQDGKQRNHRVCSKEVAEVEDKEGSNG